MTLVAERTSQEAGTADAYLRFLSSDSREKKALIACSLALHLNDDVATACISAVVKGNEGFSRRVISRLKRLGCVWQGTDENWFIIDEIRRPLLRHALSEFSEREIQHIRLILAKWYSPHNLISDSAYEEYAYRLEYGYQLSQLSDASEVGARELFSIWEGIESRSRRNRFAKAALRLSEEIGLFSGLTLPPGLAFLSSEGARLSGAIQESLEILRMIRSKSYWTSDPIDQRARYFCNLRVTQLTQDIAEAEEAAWESFGSARDDQEKLSSLEALAERQEASGYPLKAISTLKAMVKISNLNLEVVDLVSREIARIEEATRSAKNRRVAADARNHSETLFGIEIPSRIDSRFRLVLLAAQRAENLMRGARPRIDKGSKSPVSIALVEILRDLVSWDYGRWDCGEGLTEA